MLSDPFVSGVGYVNFHQEACVPLDPRRRYDEKRETAQDQDHDQTEGEDGAGDGDGPETFLEASPSFNLSREYWCYVVRE